MRFNHHMNSHFAGCVLLARGYDPHRERNVEFRAVPGEFEVVGMTDGTDAWMCPISSPWLVEVKKSLDNLRENGKPLPVVLPRAKAAEAEQQQPVARRRAVVVEKTERRRAVPVLRPAAQ